MHTAWRRQRPQERAPWHPAAAYPGQRGSPAGAQRRKVESGAAPLDPVCTHHIFHDGVPHERDAGMVQSLLLYNLRGLQHAAPVHHIDPTGEARQEEGFLETERF